MSLGVKEIRVMVVDDSILARSLIISGLSEQPHINVVGYAVNALDAQRKIPQLQPDVLTLDVEMPGMSGIDFLKQLMRTTPMPVVLVSSLNPNVFDALSDAVDFVQKPDGKTDKKAFIDLLSKKIFAASKARVRPAIQTGAAPLPVTSIPPFGPSATFDRMVIGLGASTGGTEATLEVMKRLPADIPAMLIVQHMPPGFTKMYAERLNRLCRMEVREAQDGDTLHRGLALVAPADYQMRIVRSPRGGYAVTCRSGERVSGHRPSVDALFHSMAETVKDPMVGIIMTGMGRDGADGLLAMRSRGAYTIGQDEASSVVYGMPMVAYNIGAVMVQASCQNVASALAKHLNSIR